MGRDRRGWTRGCRHTGDQRVRATAHFNLATAHAHRNTFDAATHHLVEAGRLAEFSGLHDAALFARGNLAFVRCVTGELAAAYADPYARHTLSPLSD